MERPARDCSRVKWTYPEGHEANTRENRGVSGAQGELESALIWEKTPDPFFGPGVSQESHTIPARMLMQPMEPIALIRLEFITVPYCQSGTR